jgi:hypothetical protein
MDQSLAELIQAGGNTLSYEIYKLTNSVWNNEELPQHWKGSVISLCKKGVIKLSVIIIEEYHCYQSCTKFYPIFCT